MPLPPLVDYSDAVQNPLVCFNDPELAELAAGRPDPHPDKGTPLVYSGNFAAVYPIVCGGVKYALRCFTREVNEPEKRRERYQRLSNFFILINSGAFVDYRYYERGIRVKGEWYPTIRMEWVEGSRLDKFVEDNLSWPDKIREVCDQLLKVNHDMKTLFIAHNDLQHGNLMVQEDGNIRLVDYDGFFLPQFQGQPSPELGHAQYQHPLRKADDYGEYVDNFPALVLYLSLMALSADPGLWQRFYTQDNLILTRADYADPANSECFRALKNSPDATIRHLADYLEQCCSMPVDQVPDLEEILSGAPQPSSPAPSAPPVAPGPPPASPSATGPTTRVIGGGSEYMRLLQMRQAGQVAPGLVPPPPAAPSAPPPAVPSAVPPQVQAPVSAPVMQCSRCNRANTMELIYCDNEACATVLHSGDRYCRLCGQSIPINAVYCPECGKQTV